MKKIATVLCIFLYTLILCSCGKSDKNEERVKELVAQVNELNGQLEDANSQIDELTNELNDQLENANSQINELTQELEEKTTPVNCSIDYDESTSYLAIKFWLTDEALIDPNITWYTDCYCSKKYSGTPTIVSPTVDTLDLSNNITVYACMSSEGLLYSSQYPYLYKK